MKKIILVIILYNVAQLLNAQIFNKNNFSQNNEQKIFKEVNISLNKNIDNESIDFYPLNSGDLWDYFVINDDTLFNELGMTKYTFIKEIIKDSLMGNGKIYKELKFCSCANSSNKPTEFFYHRKDTAGNIYEFIDGNEYLLFDFSLPIGSTYLSRYENLLWKVVNKYNVIGFGDTLNAIDFHLIDENKNIKQIASLVENIGLTYFYSTPAVSPNLTTWTTWNFWGAIIKGKEYSELIGNGQITDWNDYYPLHIGDVWKYKYYGSVTDDLERFQIVKDTLINDTLKYFVKIFESNSFNEIKTGRKSIERLANSGYLLNWIDEKEVPVFKFSKCVGDTFHYFHDYYWLLAEKEFDNNFTLHYLLIPDFVNANEYYEKDIGLIESTGELLGSYLIGANIEGKIWGDTTSITKIEKTDALPNEFILKQNYPNPFNPSTTIEFSLPYSGNVTLEIFDILGRKINTLVNEYLSYGSYKIAWKGNSDNNQMLTSGVYLYKLNFNNDNLLIKKMILIK